MKRTRTIKVEELFCDHCDEEITDHFGSPPGTCQDCGCEICPRCMGIWEGTISRFKGCSGTTFPEAALSRKLCLECGVKFEAMLIEAGFQLRRVTEER